MPQYRHFNTIQTQSLASGSSILYAVVSNSGSAVVKLFNGTVNPALPLTGDITGSLIATVAFNGTPVKVDYGVHASLGLVAAITTPGDITIIYD